LSEVRIRAATQADAEAIARVHVQAWNESYRGLVPDELIAALSVERNTRMWSSILGDAKSVVHVADDGAGIVGFASGGNARSAELGTSGEVTAIYLLESHKRRGIGRRLFTGLLATLASHGHRSAGLWVLVDNHVTRRFYEALGGRLGANRIASDRLVPMDEIAYVWDDLSAFAGPDGAPQIV
jgi:ribosomal protein S18 acetylase RimI-like enzyme